MNISPIQVLDKYEVIQANSSLSIPTSEDYNNYIRISVFPIIIAIGTFFSPTVEFPTRQLICFPSRQAFGIRVPHFNSWYVIKHHHSLKQQVLSERRKSKRERSMSHLSHGIGSLIYNLHVCTLEYGRSTQPTVSSTTRAALLRRLNFHIAKYKQSQSRYTAEKTISSIPYL